MAESTAPAPNSTDPRLLQLELANQIIPSDEVNNAAFEAALAPVTPVDEAPQGQDGLEALLLQSNPGLALLNEFGVPPRDAAAEADINADLALSIIQEDVQQLEEAAKLTPSTPLTADAATVDLSAEAQAITATGANAPAVQAQMEEDDALSADALRRISLALRPLSQAPLTPQLVAQIRMRVEAEGISPLHFSLQTLLLAMQYAGGLLPAAQQRAQQPFVPANDMAVRPVARVSASGEHPKR